MKPVTWRQIASAILLASVSTAGSAATMMANTSNKGSLLIWPRIDVRPGVDTILTITNDASRDVQVKCYYRSSEPVPTPLPSTFNTAFIKHTMDFSLTLTRNQTVAWSAANGRQLGSLSQVAQPFGTWPDGSLRQTGELKCFAIGTDVNGNETQINFNQLFGNATVVGAPFGVGGQAYEYNAWAFQALAGTTAQGQPVGTTPGTLNLFTTMVATALTLNPSALNPGCIVSAGLPAQGQPCGPIGPNGPFNTNNARLSYTGVLDIGATSGTTTFAESGSLKLLDWQLDALQLSQVVTGLNRAQGGNHDIYARYTITGNGQWVGPVFLTTSITSLDVTLYASPATGTPMVLGNPASGAANTPATQGITFGSKDFVLGTAQLVPDPSNLGTVALDVSSNKATTTIVALLQFTPAGGPTGPLTGASGFFQAPIPFQINIGSQAGGNALNTTYQLLPTGGVRVQTLNQLGGGSLAFVAQVNGGYDSCPNILVGQFQPNGLVNGVPFQTPPLPPAFAGGAAGTQISIVACNQDLTQRARPFITKYTWTFWNEDEFARTGTHECGDSYYETFFPTTTQAGLPIAPAQNPGPYAGFPLAQFSSLGTATAYFRVESVADTFICPNAVHFGMLGVIAQANNGVYVRGTNLIGRGTQGGLITWDPGAVDSFKK